MRECHLLGNSSWQEVADLLVAATSVRSLEGCQGLDVLRAARDEAKLHAAMMDDGDDGEARVGTAAERAAAADDAQQPPVHHAPWQPERHRAHTNHRTPPSMSPHSAQQQRPPQRSQALTLSARARLAPKAARSPITPHGARWRSAPLRPRTAATSASTSAPSTPTASPRGGAAPPHAASLITGGSAAENTLQLQLGRCVATVAPLVALSQRGVFLVNACRLFSHEPPLSAVQNVSAQSKAAAAALAASPRPNSLGVGYRYGGYRNDPMTAAAKRASGASKMPIPPRSPRLPAQSPRPRPPLFVVRRVAEDGNFWAGMPGPGTPDLPSSPAYGRVDFGESVVAK
jgi:hypothetical protein